MADVQDELLQVLRIARSKATGLKAAGAAARRPFSAFNMGDSLRANAMAKELDQWGRQKFRETNNTNVNAAVLAAIEKAKEYIKNGEDVEKVQHALKMFIVHQKVLPGLKVPPLAKRQPQLTAPSQPGPPPHARPSGAAAERSADHELAMAWWREDPWLNEHHEHWHLTVPIAGNPLTEKALDRQGELFWYMHEQMLARYDTERIALGLERVKPWENYQGSDEYGYDPGKIYLDSGWLKREPGQQWCFKDDPPGLLGTANLRAAEQWRDNLSISIETGSFEVDSGSVPITSDNLGATIEADRGTAEAWAIDLYWAATEPGIATDRLKEITNELRLTNYGQLHNSGHDLFGVGATGEAAVKGGVMAHTIAACRDPIFWRWHKHIDGFHLTWEEQKLPPHNLPDDVAKHVTIADIRLAPAEQFEDFKSFDAVIEWAKEAFNGKHSEGLTSTLFTFMNEAEITDEGGTTVEFSAHIFYLDHKPFNYLLQLVNQSGVSETVTVRVFIVAAEYAEDRRMWIEMDKFRQEVPGGKTMQIVRPDRWSSVVKKPAVRPPTNYEPGEEPKWWPLDPTDNARTWQNNYCDCGWPYHLLFPKGTTTGMAFKLMAMLTHDDLEDDCGCGSLSFCGAKDKNYPDKRPMGYPFDAPFPAGIVNTLISLEQLAIRDLTIVHQHPIVDPRKS